MSEHPARPRSQPFTHAIRTRFDRALNVGAGRMTAALVLTMALDFVQFADASWHMPMTAFQASLFLVGLGSAMRRDLGQEADVATRRYLYHGFVLLVALIALGEKWWIAVHTEVSERAVYATSYRIQGATITACGIAATLGRGRRFARFFAAFAEHPARQMALSFVLLAVFGGFLLTLPLCVRDPSAVSFIDALFMATSAVCVTGLAVHDIAATYTPIGQGVLLVLIQTGGLGIMVLSAALFVLTGRKLRAKNSTALAEMLDADSVSSLRGTIVSIIAFTFVFESLGAVALFTAFQAYPEVALPVDHPHPMAGSNSMLWASVFHAISAFCGAGLTLTRNSLVPWASSPAVCGIVMLLITLGGIGFPVHSELWHQARARLRGQRPSRITLHTRIALGMSLALSFGVGLVFVFSEWSHSLRHLTWPERVLGGLFQSVTLRSGGFNTVEFANFSSLSLAICCLVMFVGAAPGGTGGGIKVTTLAVLFAAFRAELRSEHAAHLLDRRLSETSVRRAVAVAFVSAVALTVIILALLGVEDKDPLALVFEAVSAFATVGASASVTDQLSTTGRLIIIVTMLVGRVGPLTIALAATKRGEPGKIQRAQERVLIG